MISYRVETYKEEEYLCILEELIYGCPLHKILSCEQRIKADFVKFVGFQVHYFRFS